MFVVRLSVERVCSPLVTRISLGRSNRVSENYSPLLLSMALLAVVVAAVKAVCVGSSLTLIFSGVPAAINVARSRSTRGAPILPFCIMLLDTLVGRWFSVLAGDGLYVRLAKAHIGLSYYAGFALLMARRCVACAQCAALRGAVGQ